jgi:hypothetical protein
MNIWNVLWVLWIVSFAIIEAVAISNDVDEDTLSEHLRKWFRVDTHLGRTVWLVVSGIFFAWFVVHIVS